MVAFFLAETIEITIFRGKSRPLIACEVTLDKEGDARSVLLLSDISE